MTKIKPKSLASATMSSQVFGSTGAAAAFALALALALQARRLGCGGSEAPGCNAKQNHIFQMGPCNWTHTKNKRNIQKKTS